jgi:oligoribonuclease
MDSKITIFEPTRLLWIDLEMTGLDTDIHRIVEVACIVTDFSFNEIETFNAVVHQDEDVLSASNEFSMTAHRKSGLYEQVCKSVTSEKDAENALIDIVARYFSDGGAILAGNSIGADRKFIDAHWPVLSSKLHYRMLDVSSFKVWWLGTGHEPYVKKESHRALDDIRESIEELKYYASKMKI